VSAVKKRSIGDSPLRAAGLAGAMGLDFALCILAGYFLGDRLGGTRGWAAAGILIGIAAGIASCIFLVKVVLEDGNE